MQDKKCIFISVHPSISDAWSLHQPLIVCLKYTWHILFLSQHNFFHLPTFLLSFSTPSYASFHPWTTPKEAHNCLHNMIMFLAVGTHPAMWQTARATNQCFSGKPLTTNRGVMLFHRSSQPFILQQCWQWNDAMLTDSNTVIYCPFLIIRKQVV